MPCDEVFACVINTVSVAWRLETYTAASFENIITTVSDTCGNCDCADKSQCVKKGNGYMADIINTEKRYEESYGMDGAASGEHDGKCKCGASCSCVDCTCGY